MSRFLLSLASLSAIVLAAVANGADDVRPPRVQLGDESYSGAWHADSEVAVFRGIPFADPPVGELRWQRPQPLQDKQPERSATSFAPACMQTTRILDWYRGLAETFGASRKVFDDLDVSEDCLYLNIWTPDIESRNSLPVMVYIHGGSNNSGWSYEPNYHGHALAERGVIVVSIGYRLGVFGFFSHPELDSANFGLWDQIAALEWIQKNIGAFGGDPDRVTIFGESAGAQDILALMASSRADGLYHGAIMQSNAGFGRRASPTLPDEQQRGVDLAKTFGFEVDNALAELRAVPAAELLQHYSDQFPRYYHSPAIDGQLLTKSIWDVIIDNELSPVPFIIGNNADEQYDSSDAEATPADIRKVLEGTQFQDSAEAFPAVISDPDPANAIDRIRTASGMQCPSQFLASHQTELNNNGWVYYFSRVREGEAGAEVRAYHGAELPYVFGTHDPWMTTTDTDWQLAQQMMTYWVQFAKSGNPNADSLPYWPAFKSDNGKTMEFADKAVASSAQEPVLCRAFFAAVGGPEMANTTGTTANPDQQ